MIHMTTESTSHAADIEAIDRLVATVEHSQQNKDPEEFLSLFHPDAIWTTAHGKVLIGLDMISEFTRKTLPTASWDGKVTYEVVHVLFIRPDVAAVKVRQRYLTPGEESEGAPLYVLSKQADGRWLMTACQNTPVVTD
ncbi:SgcJ/EcaC family oxidoreductase [Streptomyces sp. NPDC057900]|uniref:SgcJ/EcaC family oxidoreductase n=1 Tax=Streptomyces sp. NPDC057900 TaxID=3346274 RepID=UPI0036EF9719